MLNPIRLSLLRVDKNIVSLKVDEDKEILAEFYDPFEQSIDIDEIVTKHDNHVYGQYGNKIQSPTIDEKRRGVVQVVKKRKSYKNERSDCRIM
jgi:hypothetical protein